MTKLIFTLCFVFIVTLNMYSQGKAGARIDISGIAQGINIQVVSTADSKDYSYGIWDEKIGTKYFYITFPASTEWKKSSFSFITDKDGYLVMVVQGGIRLNEENKNDVWVFIDDITIESVKTENFKFDNADRWDFDKADKYKAELIKGAGRMENTSALKVAYPYAALRKITVTAGQEVTISFWYKSADK